MSEMHWSDSRATDRAVELCDWLAAAAAAATIDAGTQVSEQRFTRTLRRREVAGRNEIMT